MVVTSNSVRGRRGFTLIELLVVIAIIALLIGILLPALGNARDSGRALQSLSNQRQIVTSLTLYATDNRDLFPPNVPPLSQYRDPTDGKNGRRWFDQDVLGEYLPQAEDGDFGQEVFQEGNPDRATLGGGVMRNPNHAFAGRSYSMNYWASSYVATAINFGTGELRTLSAGQPGALDEGFGRPFNINVNFASSMLLVTDGWGQFWKDGNNDGSFLAFTGETVGSSGLPGQRFGVDPNYETPNLFRFQQGDRASENPEFPVDGIFPRSYIPFYRHPSRNNDIFAVRGRAQMGFADGSVRAFDQSDLVNQQDNSSSYQVLWSPTDERVERDQLGLNPNGN